MHEAAQEIKSKIDIVDFLSNLITLKRAGRNYKALCPFHQEKTPSFMVSPDRQNWRCFGACQEGGDLISFVMKWENCTFYESLQELAKITGTDLSRFEIHDETYKRKNDLATINDHAVKAFIYYLNHVRIGKSAQDYLKSREINNKIISTFKIGFAPPAKKALVSYLVKKGYSLKDIIEVGLAVKTYSGAVVDRFHNRLMFPIFDPRGIILGFSGRTLDKDVKQAKYINTPETYLYKKRETLFGISLTKKHIQDKDCVVIVEGEFDMISCFKSGIINVVAIKGSALTQEQLTLLSRYTKTITLALDADSSGLSTTKRVLPDTEKMGFKVQITMITEGKDPDDALKQNPLLFKKSIEKPVPVYDFIIDYANKKYSLSDPYQKASFIVEVGPFISKIENPIIKSHYLKKISTLLDTDIQTVEKSLTSNKISRLVQSNILPVKNPIKEKEEFIAALFFQSSNCYHLFDTTLTGYNDLFSTIAIRKLFTLFGEFKKNNSQFDMKKFTQELPAELSDKFDQIFLLDTSDIEPVTVEKKLIKVVLQLSRVRIKSKIGQYFKKKKENKNNNTQIQSLTKELSEIEKNLSLM
ncbi:DNA primase [Candidatus Roizmanbacteria bacterium RIFCSPHIGHO2_01_FULL_39_12b]|uniref:DNA primase n=1 Tax=Candidatus Roizmanbacteria bacterium RIFCSPHIGHO2_01_FULL_39_12b TaxID=1802030 RepID=A0A1F7G997_9BACT|nr:MAG: DNA primase [Candidatus Roizmanbacteria bacterium RIFCSPHIGHO2_01_FULL_39_12b]OGK45971.1 MAG: DNA primase [Candidatus Roizmanbacteria bacterium RIFCSPLOWO2_01_FULL_39_19]